MFKSCHFHQTTPIVAAAPQGKQTARRNTARRMNTRSEIRLLRMVLAQNGACSKWAPSGSAISKPTTERPLGMTHIPAGWNESASFSGAFFGSPSGGFWSVAFSRWCCVYGFSGEFPSEFSGFVYHIFFCTHHRNTGGRFLGLQVGGSAKNISENEHDFF